MKQLVLIFMSLLTFSCPSKAQKQTADTDRPSDKKILVAYFSCTGTTEKVATAIAKETGGKLTGLLRLRPTLRRILTGTTKRAAVRWR